jgi:DNA-binding transcriptional ArsR family regulator
MDNARQLALMHALAAFSHVLAGQFTTADLYPRVLQILGSSPEKYKLNALRYDLSKLRAKGLVEKIPRSRRYQFTGQGYRLSVVYLKLFEKLYAPLTAGVMHPCSNDRLLPLHRTAALDQLYLASSRPSTT